jgi:hypothetical protein
MFLNYSADYQWEAELITLSMTIPTIVLGLGVLHRWGKPAWASFQNHSLDSMGWFIIGVFIAFLGYVLDSLYWCIPLAMSLLGFECSCGKMQELLVYNLMVRQVAGLSSAYCHLKAADMSSSRSGRLTNTMVALCYLTVCILAAVFGLSKGL